VLLTAREFQHPVRLKRVCPHHPYNLICGGVIDGDLVLDDVYIFHLHTFAAGDALKGRRHCEGVDHFPSLAFVFLQVRNSVHFKIFKGKVVPDSISYSVAIYEAASRLGCTIDEK
jgi:hypothetical protein